MNEPVPGTTNDPPQGPELSAGSITWSGTRPDPDLRLAGTHPRSWLPLVVAGVVISVIATMLVWSWLAQNLSEPRTQGLRGDSAERSRPVS